MNNPSLRKIGNVVFGLLLCCALIGPAFAQTAVQSKALEIFESVQAGQMNAKSGLSDLESLEGAKQDPVVRAVHGTLLTLRAADAYLPFRKLKFVNDGLEELDGATTMVSTSDSEFLRVYMFAAIGNASVPKFLDRDEFAMRYFSAIVKHPNFGQMGPSNLATVYAWLAKLEGVKTENGKAFAEKANAADHKTAKDILDRR